MNPQPLAHARRRPGRPRKVQPGHTTGTPPPQLSINTAANDRALASTAIAPRLLGIEDAARYLGVSYWTVLDLRNAGTLRAVALPLRSVTIRRTLFDRDDLDRLIESWKEVNDLPC